MSGHRASLTAKNREPSMGVEPAGRLRINIDGVVPVRNGLFGVTAVGVDRAQVLEPIDVIGIELGSTLGSTPTALRKCSTSSRGQQLSTMR